MSNGKLSKTATRQNCIAKSSNCNAVQAGVEQRDRLKANAKRWLLSGVGIHSSRRRSNIGLLLACSLPLALAWLLLARPPDTGDEQAVVEIMLDDLTAKQPWLLYSADEDSPHDLKDA